MIEPNRPSFVRPDDRATINDACQTIKEVCERLKDDLKRQRSEITKKNKKAA